MCVLVELFDSSEPVENIAGGLAVETDRIIYIGSDRAVFEKHAERYGKFFGSRGLDIAFEFRQTAENSAEETTRVYGKIFEDYSGCVIDVSGGDDLALVSAGIAAERFPSADISVIRTDPSDGTVKTVFGKCPPLRADMRMKLSVAENIAIHGGTVCGVSDMPDSGSFLDDVEEMWRKSIEEPERWNKACLIMMNLALHASYDSKSGIYSIDSFNYGKMISNTGRNVRGGEKMLSALRDKNLLTEYNRRNGGMELAFRNGMIKECLTKIGLVSELKIYKACLDLKDREGRNYFDDVKTSVIIHWDEEPKAADICTVNEVDIIAARGMTPYFISCKSGKYDANELNKLFVVAEYFGGRRCRKALFSVSPEPAAMSVHERAAEMGISLFAQCRNDDIIRGSLYSM